MSVYNPVLRICAFVTLLLCAFAPLCLLFHSSLTGLHYVDFVLFPRNKIPGLFYLILRIFYLPFSISPFSVSPFSSVSCSGIPLFYLSCEQARSCSVYQVYQHVYEPSQLVLFLLQEVSLRQEGRPSVP